MLFALCSYGQTNLVPNPSFEQYTTCPNSQSQVPYAVGWSVARLTADYFNSCATYTSTVGIPASYFGYQYPASGNGMMGFYSYLQISSTMKREAIGCQLTTTLSIGTKYYVSLKANLASIHYDVDSVNYYFCLATDHLGALFSTVPYSTGSPSPINNFAQVYAHIIINDTLNWTQVFGSFIADSAYKYLTLGNFFDNAHTNTTFFPPCAVNDTATYYFWDDICVSTDSAYTNNYHWTGIENEINKDNFILFPNPASDYLYIKNNKPEPFEVSIYSALGQLLFYQKDYFTETAINISNLPPQMLFIKINKNNQIYNYKLTKT